MPLLARGTREGQVPFLLKAADQGGCGSWSRHLICRGRDLQKQSDPPVEAVSVIGGPVAIADFRLCLEDLPNTRVKETGRVPLDRLVTFTLDYRTPVDRPQDDPALLNCLDGPVATAPQFQYRQPPLGVLLAGGSDSEVTEVQRCLAALPDVDVIMREPGEGRCHSRAHGTR